jgi:hypothetical protein
MTSRTLVLAASAVALALGGTFAARSAADAPRHDVPKSKDGNLVVALCDGETTMEVAGVKDGGSMNREQAQAVSEALMQEWKRKNPNARWEDAPVQLAQADTGIAGPGGAAPGEGLPDKPDGRAGGQVPPSPPTDAAGEPGGAGAAGNAAVDAPRDATQSGIYSAYTDRDDKVWMAATDKFVQEGNRIFHDANAFGGTIGVSCDMCHPDGANTHPETYPKFQVQLGRVAMLRDMINWCIENPTRGQALRDDDVRLKAMEAYILAQRKGVALAYGKH